MTHICVGTLTIISSDNGLSPSRRQAIIWTNAGLLLMGPLGTNFNEILIKILTFSFKKMLLKVSTANWRPFCLGLNVLMPPTCHCVQYRDIWGRVLTRLLGLTEVHPYILIFFALHNWMGISVHLPLKQYIWYFSHIYLSITGVYIIVCQLLSMTL